jgi:hypothetical protein
MSLAGFDVKVVGGIATRVVPTASKIVHQRQLSSFFEAHYPGLKNLLMESFAPCYVPTHDDKRMAQRDNRVIQVHTEYNFTLLRTPWQQASIVLAED